jgi:hypothetical protein
MAPVLAVLAAGAVAASMMLPVGCGGPGAAGYPSAPDEAVLHVAGQLHDQHPEVLWEALPPSYRSDITELVHGYAGKLDAQLYGQAFDLIGRAVEILKTKKQIFLDSKTFERIAAADREEVGQHWDSIVGMVETVTTSDLASLEQLQTIDIGTFLATTGRTLMQQAADASRSIQDDPYSSEVETKLSQVKVETVEVEGDLAILRITVPDQPTEEVRMVRIEDRWVPKELADDWEKGMAEAREQLAKLDESSMAQGKMQAALAMGMLDAFLTQIEQAETPDELDQVINGVLGGIMRRVPAAGSGMEVPEDDA